ncbi:alpha-keto acid decarboxylase family protein [Dinghuibacter silviterrae]|uniref:Indolepyruvate decarboxylase n=1 Tax=Dinghuibacter silviterrae TaxID=1539049 RepID=A0A4R8DFK2_9BACT|nr:thiamine pyrophosphate-dependent enzyme [Dinghuibacter silviterrae]TDW96379.1 indolepyruvate decarboxylase [Dinghuibacter silviterrae]
MSYTISNYILDRLKELHIRHVFSVPGDYASIFLETLVDDKDIELIPNINELGVGYATDGYGRFNGAAACSVQYGVGTFSILNCFAGGLVERVPMVLIGPTLSTTSMELERTKGILFHHSTGDLSSNYEAMKYATIMAVQVEDNETGPARIDEALTAMISFKRPVYIEVRQNVFGEPCTPPTRPLSVDSFDSNPGNIQAAVDAAWEKISAASAPVLWYGIDIQRFSLQSSAQALVDAGHLLFTTTSLGKTVLDETQPNFIGTYAGPASPDYTRIVMAATDCPIALGAIITDDYLDIMRDKYDLMIEASGDEVRVGREHFWHVPLAAFMEGILGKIKAEGLSPLAYPTRPAVPAPAPLSPSASLTYELFYAVMDRWLVAEAHIKESILILGESSSLYVFGNLMGLPANSFVAQAAWGSLGHETGCALGIELATGKRPLVVAGDGGFMMVCQEISSLARQHSNAVVFVMSNASYTIEQAFVDIKAFSPGGQFAPFDLLPKWDYLSLAKAFGADGYSVGTVGELAALLNELSAPSGKPSLVEVRIPQKDLPPQIRRLATPGSPLQARRHRGM